MTGHRSFNELRKAMPPERRARNVQATQEMLEEIALREPRLMPEKAQEKLAQKLLRSD